MTRADSSIGQRTRAWWRGRPQLPVLLLFISFGRMAEIRPDTFGLLLFNLAWWQVLRGTGRTNILLAAALSGAALLFSARAAVMIVGMGLLLSLLCARKKDVATVGYLVLMAVAFGALVLLGAEIFLSESAFGLLFVSSILALAAWGFAYSWHHSRTHAGTS